MISTVIGVAMLPHDPQFFTMPETEDRNTVERVKAAAAEIGTQLRALRPDLWIIFANDHVEQFFHTAAPPFTIHVGGEAKGEFSGHQFHWRVPGQIGFEIVCQMYAQGFDRAFTSVAKIDYVLGIPLTHLATADPVLPIYVNAYLPPQPSMERCYAFGQALARIVSARGLDTAVLARGACPITPALNAMPRPTLPGIARRSQGLPLVTSNRWSAVTRPNSTPPAMSNSGAGLAPRALGERKPDIVSLEPSWHHNYASLGWLSPLEARPEPHYPSIKPELVELTVAPHGLAHDEASRATFLADGAGCADHFRLTAEQREALIALDLRSIVRWVPIRWSRFSPICKSSASPAAESSTSGDERP
jgi:2,3-dihydroxyphenylpropionate 1,2-dioxygenase